MYKDCCIWQMICLDMFCDIEWQVSRKILEDEHYLRMQAINPNTLHHIKWRNIAEMYSGTKIL